MSKKQEGENNKLNNELEKKFKIISNEKIKSEKENAKLLEELEQNRFELSELYKMVESLKSTYLIEQKKISINNETNKNKEGTSKIEQENKYLQARLSAYRNSKLGKITTWYWNFRKK